MAINFINKAKIAKIKEAILNRVKRDANSRLFKRQENLDQVLVRSLTKGNNFFPSLKQLKQLPGFLSKKEKSVIKVLGIIIILSLVYVISSFYFFATEKLPMFGGEYTEAIIGKPQFINPLLAFQQEADMDLVQLIFSGLFKYNQKLEIIPDLADNYVISEDKKTYTITLKKGVKWHNGDDFSADDVIFTFDLIKDPDYHIPLATGFVGISWQKVDDYTVQFNLKEPYSSFLSFLTFGILPKNVWGGVGAEYFPLADYNFKKPIGTGPFIASEFKHDSLGGVISYTLARNENYYGQKPYLEKIKFVFYNDLNEVPDALRNKIIDGVSYIPKDFKQELSTISGLNYYSLLLPQYTAIFFNQDGNVVLKDRDLRIALAYSLDKNYFIQNILDGDGEVVDGPILPGFVGYYSDIVKYNYNVLTANDLLDKLKWQKITPEEYQDILQKEEDKKRKEAEALNSVTETTVAMASKDLSLPINRDSSAETAVEKNKVEEITNEVNSSVKEKELETVEGKKEENQILFYRLKNNNVLTITLTTVDLPLNVMTAEAIKIFWQDIGVKVELNLVDPEIINREIIKPRNYEVLLYGELIGSDPDPFPFWHSSQIKGSGLNLSKYVNRKADKLMEDARVESDPVKRGEKYIEFQKILTEDLPAIFLYYPTYTYVVSSSIKGMEVERINLPANRFSDINGRFIKSKRQFTGDYLILFKQWLRGN